MSEYLGEKVEFKFRAYFPFLSLWVAIPANK